MPRHAYLLDRKHDPALLAKPATPVVRSESFTDEERHLLQTLLRMVRNAGRRRAT